VLDSRFWNFVFLQRIDFDVLTGGLLTFVNCSSISLRKHRKAKRPTMCRALVLCLIDILLVVYGGGWLMSYLMIYDFVLMILQVGGRE
jgi:hypothetical protein